MTLSAPRTFRNVSCWPAKLAWGRSSAVAEERTATGAEVPSPSALYASVIASTTFGGTGAASRELVSRGGRAETRRHRQPGPGQLAQVRPLPADHGQRAAIYGTEREDQLGALTLHLSGVHCCTSSG